MKYPLQTLVHVLAAICMVSAVHAQDGAAAQSSSKVVSGFTLHFDSGAFAEGTKSDFSGEVFVAFAEEGEPRDAAHQWFGAPPILRFDLKDAKQGDVIELTLEDALSMDPAGSSSVWQGESNREWRVQAFARFSRTGREAGRSAGDVFSEVRSIRFAPGTEGALELHLDHIAVEAPLAETDQVRLFKFTSPALSKFYGFKYSMRAGVLLPKDYDPGKKYPVIYSVTGFGSTHHRILAWERRASKGGTLENCIVVVPDANHRLGHSVFCDSESVGPWGQALVYELIPALEKEYGGAGAAQRYVTGVSSGGWSSLWLQVTYPEEFNSCWSHVPDPIDFHDFQQINLYEPLEDGSPRNMYVDEDGNPRGLARRNGEVMLHYKEFAQREHVLNPGGQIRSFDATFSPLGEDGQPRRVFDIETGVIDHEAVKAWRKYDISNTLLTGWAELQPRLKGKIHVYAGGEDTFYLEGAVERFQGLAREAGMLEDMVIEVVPGMPHTQYEVGFEAMLERIRKDASLPLPEPVKSEH
ncbi:MAG: hypothetical protein ACI87O_001514 [Planctomycetota bacterium]|jgi:hypothetical protein